MREKQVLMGNFFLSISYFQDIFVDLLTMRLESKFLKYKTEIFVFKLFKSQIVFFRMDKNLLLLKNENCT